MTWWPWLLGFAWAVLFWIRVRRASKSQDTRLLAGSSRDMLGRGGF